LLLLRSQAPRHRSPRSSDAPLQLRFYASLCLASDLAAPATMVRFLQLPLHVVNMPSLHLLSQMFFNVFHVNPDALIPTNCAITTKLRFHVRGLLQSITSYNGSALIAMVGKNCFAIASDRRLGVNFQTIATDFQRIFKIHDKLYIGLSGLATDVQTM
jgi:hypothetical protein